MPSSINVSLLDNVLLPAFSGANFDAIFQPVFQDMAGLYLIVCLVAVNPDERKSCEWALAHSDFLAEPACQPQAMSLGGSGGGSSATPVIASVQHLQASNVSSVVAPLTHSQQVQPTIDSVTSSQHVQVAGHDVQPTLFSGDALRTSLGVVSGFSPQGYHSPHASSLSQNNFGNVDVDCSSPVQETLRIPVHSNNVPSPQNQVQSTFDSLALLQQRGVCRPNPQPNFDSGTPSQLVQVYSHDVLPTLFSGDAMRTSQRIVPGFSHQGHHFLYASSLSQNNHGNIHVDYSSPEQEACRIPVHTNNAFESLPLSQNQVQTTFNTVNVRSSQQVHVCRPCPQPTFESLSRLQQFQVRPPVQASFESLSSFQQFQVRPPVQPSIDSVTPLQQVQIYGPDVQLTLSSDHVSRTFQAFVPGFSPQGHHFPYASSWSQNYHGNVHVDYSSPRQGLVIPAYTNNAFESLPVQSIPHNGSHVITISSDSESQLMPHFATNVVDIVSLPQAQENEPTDVIVTDSSMEDFDCEVIIVD